MQLRTKVGFFSGTFNPVHTGHIEFVLAAIEQYNLSKVLILPEELPREKLVKTTYEHRMNMLHIATEGFENIELVRLKNKTFSVAKTLPELRVLEPGADLVFLCGSDVVKTFLYRWEGLETLLGSVEVVVGLRNNESEADVRNIIGQLPFTARIHVMKAPKHHLASTMVRQGVHTIEDIHPAVADYIKTNDLYS